MRLLTIVALLALPSAAWAERSVTFASVGVELRFPDDWTAEALFQRDGFELVPAGGESIGWVEVFRDESCPRLIELMQEQEPLPIGAWAVVSEAWSGYGYGEGRGYYCRDVAVDGVTFTFVVQGHMEELGLITTIVDDGLARGAAAPEPPAQPVTPEDWAGSPTHEIEVELRASWRTARLKLVVPTAWKQSRDGTVEYFKLEDGRTVGSISFVHGKCAQAFDALERELGMNERTAIDEWSGAQGGTTSLYCREQGRLDVYAFLVVGAIGATPSILAAADPAVDAYFASTAERPSPAWFTFLPDRYELGIARLTDGDTGMLTDDEGWGVSLNLERTTYGRGVPAWGYRARATPTGAGFAGHAEGTLGASFKGLSVQGVAGVGVAGDAAPLTVHGGIHGGVFLGFLELEGGYAWTPNGSVTRIEGGFLVPAGGWAAGIRIGYERREDSKIITIDSGATRIPPGLLN